MNMFAKLFSSKRTSLEKQPEDTLNFKIALKTRYCKTFANPITHFNQKIYNFISHFPDWQY